MATSQEANNPEKSRKAPSSKKAGAAPAEETKASAETAEPQDPEGDQPRLERPAVLWKQMSETQRQAAAHAFWTDPQSQMEHLEINALMARRLNFRMKSIQTMAVDRKVKHLMAMGNVSDGVAGRLLVTYHLASQRGMMGAFLDALGIAHEEGLIAEDATPQPEPEKLKAAAATLREKYPAEDVNLYFSTLVLQDSETWGGLLDELPPL
jgi:hypothetical protein